MASPLEHLVWSLQALALGAADQRAVFPPFVLLGDELALAFDDARLAIRQEELSASQAVAIEAIDRLLADMTSQNDVELWTREAVERGADWQRLRLLAASALRVLGFPLAVPPFGLGAIYVASGAERSAFTPTAPGRNRSS